MHLCRVPAHGCGQMFTKSYTYDKNLVASVAYSKDNGYICTEIWIISAALGKTRASSALRSLARDLDNHEVSAKERMYYVFGGLWWLLVVLVVNIFHQKCD